MGFNIDPAAIAAAAAVLKAQPKEAQPKSEPNTTTHAKRTAKHTPKTSPTAAKPEKKPRLKCVADLKMMMAISNYLYTRPDMIGKLANPKKSVEGCCNYIIGKMAKIAKKQCNGAGSVGFFQDDSTVYGMAVHYYDETDEDLAKEDEEDK